MKLIQTLLLIIATSLAATAVPPERTTRAGRLRAKTTPRAEMTATGDTVAASTEFTISGYDKPLRSTGESFFVTNHTDNNVSAIELCLSYFDTNKRQLHERTVWVTIDLPARATRRADIPTWDKRQTLYYVKGVEPRRDNVTPFDVVIKPLRYVK